MVNGATGPPGPPRAPAVGRRWRKVAITAIVVAAALGGLLLTGRTLFFSGESSFPAVAQPVSRVALNFKTSGRLAEMDVKPGQRVVKGDRLAMLDQQVGRLALDAAKAALAADEAQLALLQSPPPDQSVEQLQLGIQQAQQELNAAQQSASDVNRFGGTQQAHDNAQNAVVIAQTRLSRAQGQLTLKSAPPTPARIESTQAAIAKDQAAIAVSQEQLDNLALTSPMAGIVMSVNGNVGDLVSADGVRNFSGATSVVPVQPGFELFRTPAAQAGSGPAFSSLIEIGDLSRWQVVAQVAERDISRVRAGEPVSITFNAVPDKLNGHVTAVAPAPVTNQQGVYYNVTADAEGAPSGLLPGMTATLSISSKPPSSPVKKRADPTPAAPAADVPHPAGPTPLPTAAPESPSPPATPASAPATPTSGTVAGGGSARLRARVARAPLVVTVPATGIVLDEQPADDPP